MAHAGVLVGPGPLHRPGAFQAPDAEAFFSSLQRELLDQHHWETGDQLARAMFEWIDTWYKPRRRHSYDQGLSPIDYENANAA